uniref:Uncharacterized protein n=1 Tax=Arundo donax TaxID=35708 RepID=A0A0A9E953_ARUDO
MVKNELLIDLDDEKSSLSCSSLSQHGSHPNKFTELFSIGQAEYEERISVVNETPVSFCSSLTEKKCQICAKWDILQEAKKPEEVHE